MPALLVVDEVEEVDVVDEVALDVDVVAMPPAPPALTVVALLDVEELVAPPKPPFPNWNDG